MDSRTKELLTPSEAERGEYIWELNNPLSFKLLREDYGVMNQPYDHLKVRIMFNHCLKKRLEIHKCFLTWTISLHSQAMNSRFFGAFKYLVKVYLKRLGVISINNVIRAVNHVLFDQLTNVIECDLQHEIKFNIY
ncbi:REn [Desmodium mottle virus]|uniref:Replication enhancer n=1 Tax=Desmodium mottle virus TaxID=1960710 RepID=A0A1S6GNC0_9GEMI|nr:REn [Desmodium mottle virus]AQS23360.1 REn [Desmodium mottle virus]AQS23368.1 REn [Desmodium mottle virus]